jgi:hypothetical protein
MPYDPMKWHEEQQRNRPRNLSSKLLMGFGLAFVLGCAIAFPILGPAYPHTSFPVFGLAMPALMGAAFTPFSRGIWGNSKSAKFDEFEQQSLNRAAMIAYRIIIPLAAFLCFWCAIGLSNNWPIPSTPNHWVQIGWTFLTFGLVLPVFIAELIIPMPPKAEMEDDA